MIRDLRIFIAVAALTILASYLFFCSSCKKNALPSQIYGTYAGSSTNSGLFETVAKADTTIPDSIVITAGGTTTNSDTVNVKETHFNVTLMGIVSSDDDTLYIPTQIAVYNGDSCYLTNNSNPGLFSSNTLTLTILEQHLNQSTAGQIVFNGTD